MHFFCLSDARKEAAQYGCVRSGICPLSNLVVVIHYYCSGGASNWICKCNNLLGDVYYFITYRSNIMNISSILFSMGTGGILAFNCINLRFENE